jgi:hypothetical protein
VIVYVAGRVHAPDWNEWEVLGIYSKLERAEARCTSFSDFVGAAPLDHDLLEEYVPWPGAHFPLRDATPPAKEGT